MAKVEVDIFANDHTGSVFSKIGSGLSGILTTAAGFVTGQLFMQAGAAIANFATSSIASASNLNETLSKTGEIFGSTSQSIIEWSKNSATSVGLSQGAALDAAGSFAIFGKAAGLAGQDLNNFATDNLQLAADMASFFNTSVEEASTAISSAFRGETEPIRKYGVMLDDASMRAKALELGIVSTTKTALTPQQKVLAAQALIFEQTSDAQGDFARTSGGLANQQRILAAQFENVKTTVGTAFLPIMTDLMANVINPMMPAIQDLATRFGEWMNTLKESSALQALMGIFTTLSDTIIGFTNQLSPDSFGNFEQLAPVFESISAAIAGLSSFSLEGTPLGNFLNALQAWGITYGPGLQESFNSIFGTISETVGYVFGKLGEVFTNVMGNITLWLNDNGPLIDNFIAVLATAIGFIGDVVQVIADVVAPLLEMAVGNILNILTVFMAVITGDWSKAWEAMQKYASDASRYLGQALTALWTGILRLFGTSQAQLSIGWKTFWTNLWESIKTWIANVVEAWNNFWKSIVDGISQWVNAVYDYVAVFFDAGQNLIWGLIDGIKSMIDTVRNAIKDVAEAIANKFAEFNLIKSPSRLYKKYGEYMMQGLAEGIGDGATIPIRAMNDVMPRLGVSPIYSGGMGGIGAGAGGIIINIDARDSLIDERWFATKFKTGVVQILRDTGVVFRG